MSRQADEIPGSRDAGEQPVGRDPEVAQNALGILELKQRVLDELEKSGFPDLEFLFSPEALAVVEDVLDSLLIDSEKKFEDTCSLCEEQIHIDIFLSENHLLYLYQLLKSFKNLHNNDQIRGILERFKEKYVAYENKILYSRRYYEVLRTCALQEDLAFEETRFLEVMIQKYEMRGINLDIEKQSRLQEIHIELSRLSDTYSNNLVDEEEGVKIHIKNRDVFEDMPTDVIEQAQERSREQGGEGYIFGINQIPDVMKYCSDRSIRQKTYQTYTSLASKGEKSNREVVIKMLQLRDERAKILGYTCHADYAMNTKMSDSFEEVVGYLEEIFQKARIIAESDVDDIKTHFGLNEFEVWDYAFYQRKYEKTQNNFDISSVKPYFEAKQVISGMFEIIQKLFGIHLTESDIPTYGEGNVYEAYKDGVLLGYLWCDFYESDKKMTGAWAESIRSGSTINARGERVKKHKIVINAGNITQKTDGDTLLDFRDVETLFHEIGHALHELCYEGDFLSLSGLHTEDDFVELPSQLLENWCRSPEGLKYIAKHHITGEALPEETILKILESRSFHSAYGVVRYLMFSFYDLALHSKDIPQDGEEFDIFSLQELQEKSLFPVQDYFTLYANLDHLFYEADSMYAAGYFSYIWAEMIEQDIWNAFKSSGDVFNPELAEKYYRTILAQGFMKPGKVLFQDLMGRDLDPSAYLESKHLI